VKLHEKRTIIGAWDKRVWLRRARMFLMPRFCWLYSEKGGGAVLKGQTSWRKLCGIQFHVGTWQLFLSWRKP
jgi:hypothetical protein